MSPPVRGHVAVEGGGLRPPPEAVDGDRLAAGRVVEDGGGHAAEVGEVRQDDVDGDAARHTGVDGVAALLQQAVARGTPPGSVPAEMAWVLPITAGR